MAGNPYIHLCFVGSSCDLEFEDIDLSFDADDEQILKACSDWLNLPISKVQNFIVDRAPSGEITVCSPIYMNDAKTYL